MTTAPKDLSPSDRSLWSVLAGLLVVRLVTMAVLPLTDTTEARYGEIARKMVETGDWVTLWHDYGVPFWAKPPLSTWASALGMELFGVNEFAARLSSLLFTLASAWFVAQLVRERRGATAALLTAIVYLSTALGFAASGAVMTDPSLVFASSLLMVALWRHRAGAPRWGLVAFVAGGIGLLAKGPLIAVLAGLPMFAWSIWRREWRWLPSLPWLVGIPIAAAIAVPWYALAELRTPGFLDYFLIGEHVRRFLIPGWTGDLYGHAHAAPLGMVWLYAVVLGLPWLAVALIGVARGWRTVTAALHADDGWLAFLVVWTLMPLVFFSLSRNVIWPYVLPSLPAFAALVIELGAVTGSLATRSAFTDRRILVALCSLAPLVFVGLTAWIDLAPASAPHNSQAPVVAEWRRIAGGETSRLVYWRHRFYSAEFYTGGKARTLDSEAELAALDADGLRDFIAVPVDLLATLPTRYRAGYRQVAQVEDVLLLEEPAAGLPPDPNPVTAHGQ